MELSDFEKQIIAVIESVPLIEYKGRAMQIGIWETSDFIDADPNIGEVWRAKFRFIFYFPENGVELMKIEMYPAPFYDWETVFNGIIPSIDFLNTLLTRGLSITLTPKQ